MSENAEIGLGILGITVMIWIGSSTIGTMLRTGICDDPRYPKTNIEKVIYTRAFCPAKRA